MYNVVLVFSLVIWAIVIAIIVSTPQDMLRTVELLRSLAPHQKPAGRRAPRIHLNRTITHGSRSTRSSRQRT